MSLTRLENLRGHLLTDEFYSQCENHVTIKSVILPILHHLTVIHYIKPVVIYQHLVHKVSFHI